MQEGLIPVIDKYGQLLCPNCDHQCMHQTQVQVEQRVHEDGEAQVTVCENAQVVSKRVKKVAGRRDNLYVEFWCESCMDPNETHKHHTLSIQQHKGVTYLRWI